MEKERKNGNYGKGLSNIFLYILTNISVLNPLNMSCHITYFNSRLLLLKEMLRICVSIYLCLLQVNTKTL